MYNNGSYMQNGAAVAESFAMRQETMKPNFSIFSAAQLSGSSPRLVQSTDAPLATPPRQHSGRTSLSSPASPLQRPSYYHMEDMNALDGQQYRFDGLQRTLQNSSAFDGSAAQQNYSLAYQPPIQRPQHHQYDAQQSLVGYMEHETAHAMAMRAHPYLMQQQQRSQQIHASHLQLPPRPPQQFSQQQQQQPFYHHRHHSADSYLKDEQLQQQQPSYHLGQQCGPVHEFCDAPLPVPAQVQPIVTRSMPIPRYPSDTDLSENSAFSGLGFDPSLAQSTHYGRRHASLSSSAGARRTLFSDERDPILHQQPAQTIYEALQMPAPAYSKYSPPRSPQRATGAYMPPHVSHNSSTSTAPEDFILSSRPSSARHSRANSMDDQMDPIAVARSWSEFDAAQRTGQVSSSQKQYQSATTFGGVTSIFSLPDILNSSTGSNASSDGSAIHSLPTSARSSASSRSLFDRQADCFEATPLSAPTLTASQKAIERPTARVSMEPTKADAQVISKDASSQTITTATTTAVPVPAVRRRPSSAGRSAHSAPSIQPTILLNSSSKSPPRSGQRKRSSSANANGSNQHANQSSRPSVSLTHRRQHSQQVSSKPYVEQHSAKTEGSVSEWFDEQQLDAASQAAPAPQSTPILPSPPASPSRSRSMQPKKDSVQFAPAQSRNPAPAKSNQSTGSGRRTPSPVPMPSASIASLGDSTDKGESAECKAVRKQMKALEKDGLAAVCTYAQSQMRTNEALQVQYHWRIYMDLADLAKRENNIQQARDFYGKVNILEPGAAQGWLEHAKLEEEAGELERCEVLLEQGLSVPSCQYNEGLIIKYVKHMEQKNNLEKARSVLRRVMRLSIDKCWKIIMEGALMESRAGEIIKARSIFAYLMNHVPKHGPIFYEAYRLEEKCEEYELALRIVEKGLNENPRYGPLWFAAMHVHEQLAHHRYNQAKAMAQQSGDEMYGQDGSGNKVDLTSVRGVVKQAIDTSNISKELHWKVHYEHALIEERAGFLDRAREAFAFSSIEAMPNLKWKVQVAAARLELASGQQSGIATARKLVEQALEDVPIKSKAVVLIEYARLEEYLGNLDSARQRLAQAKQESQQEWKVFLEAILLEMRSGELHRAISEAEKALEIHPGTGRLWAMLIQLRHMDWSANAKTSQDPYFVFKRAIESVPKSGEVWCEGARVHLNPTSPRFSLDEARKCLENAMKFTPQYGDSLIEWIRLDVFNISSRDEESESRFLEQLCVNADPNYGPLWVHCKKDHMEGTRRVLRRAKRLIREELRDSFQFYHQAIRGLQQQQQQSVTPREMLTINACTQHEKTCSVTSMSTDGGEDVTSAMSPLGSSSTVDLSFDDVGSSASSAEEDIFVEEFDHHSDSVYSNSTDSYGTSIMQSLQDHAPSVDTFVVGLKSYIKVLRSMHSSGSPWSTDLNHKQKFKHIFSDSSF